MQEIKMKTEFIKLDSFLKWAGAVSQGSEGKAHILGGEVKVNGEIELRRGKKIYPGDQVDFNGEIYLAVAE